MQNNEVRNGKFISNAVPVVHKVDISKTDMEYLNKTATSILTYWFVDCVYYGFSKDFTFVYQYPIVDSKHKLEALVVAAYEPITTPSTSTVKRTTPTNDSLTVQPLEAKHSVINLLSPILTNSSSEYVCQSNRGVPPDKSRTYGLFTKQFISIAPVSNISITGNY